MNLQQTELFNKELKYFKKRLKRQKVWCNRFPQGIDFRGKTVLDVGCGNGSLGFYALDRGAKRVDSIDLNSRLIDFCNWVLFNEYVHYINIVSFFLYQYFLKNYLIIILHYLLKYYINILLYLF